MTSSRILNLVNWICCMLLRIGFNHAMLVEIAIQKLVGLGLMESNVWIFGATSVRMIHPSLLHVEVMDLESKDVEDVKKATTSSWSNFNVHQMLHQLEKLSVPHFRRLMTRWMVEHKSGGWKLVSFLLSLPGLSYCSTGKTQLANYQIMNKLSKILLWSLPVHAHWRFYISS